jgi:FG-GAP-like repeat/FG-GAP repeat
VDPPSTGDLRRWYDWNGDGRDDLIVGSYVGSPFPDALTILLSSGDGTFIGSQYSLDFYPNAMAVGDFNGDGHADIAIISEFAGAASGGLITLLPGSGNGSLQPAIYYDIGNYGAEPTSLAVADINGDGRTDLITNSNEDFSTPLRVWLGVLASLFERMMADKPHPEMGYRGCLGVIRLAGKYTHTRMEAAAELALLTGACRYRSIESILKNSLDQQPLPSSAPATAPPPPRHDNIRGAEYFE